MSDPIIPSAGTPAERGAAAMETTPEQWAEATTSKRCQVCKHLVELADPDDPESWVHAEDGDWGDHTAEV